MALQNTGWLNLSAAALGTCLIVACHTSLILGIEAFTSHKQSLVK
jgi:hypothetical protein